MAKRSGASAVAPHVALRRSTRTVVVAATTAVKDKRKREADSDASSSTTFSEREEEVPIKPKKKKRKRTKAVVAATVAVAEDASEVQIEAPKPKKARKPRAPKPEPVYVIPDVVQKQTTFRGRLGYACLNTVLRNKKPASESIFCSRTCRLDSLQKNGMDWVKDLGKRNAEDAIKLIEWNEKNKIRFMRLSSEMFPFASHGTHGYTLEYCDATLKEVGKTAKKYGHRLTMHPGQFTQLGSPKEAVRASAVRELEYHCEILDRMGIDQDGVMIVHGGGVYDSKEEALKRIKYTISNDLKPNVRARLVLENDEFCYNAEDLLPLCEELDVPLVFDYHHDSIYPSSIPPSEIIRRANAIFSRRGIKPKQHLSQPRPGAVTAMERRAHSDRCDFLPQELEIHMGLVGEDGKGIDLMIEAKDKEQAVLELYRIYSLEEVEHASLRPPKENQTKHTLGRKSNRKRKGAEDRDDPHNKIQTWDPCSDPEKANFLEPVDIDEAVAVEDSNLIQDQVSQDIVQEAPSKEPSTATDTAVPRPRQSRKRKTQSKP